MGGGESRSGGGGGGAAVGGRQVDAYVAELVEETWGYTGSVVVQHAATALSYALPLDRERARAAEASGAYAGACGRMLTYAAAALSYALPPSSV